MTLTLQLFVIALCALFLIGTLRLVAKGRLQIKYSLMWILLAIVMLVFSIFPRALFWLSHFLGFAAPSNFILLLAVFFLLAICMSLSIVTSWQSDYIRSLVQKIAILENDLSPGSSNASPVDAAETDHGTNRNGCTKGKREPRES